MATKTLRVFAEYTSTGFVPMPTAGNIDYGFTLGSTFPATTPATYQTDNPDLVVTVNAMTDFYVWIRINGQAWNPSYTRNVRVYPDSANINNVVMNMIIATGPAGVAVYTQIVQTSNRLYFNGATTDATYNSKFAGKTYINELNFGTAPGLATVATSGAYADLTGKPTLATVATSGLFTDLSSKPSGTAPLSYNSGTNSFVITQANTSTNGYLSSTDWNTFNNKLATPAGTTLQYVDGTGALQTFPLLASADKLVINVRNASGVSMPKGSVVYINGATGNKPTVALAQANSDASSAQTLGLLQATLANNAEGNVVIVGSIIDLNTSAFTEGQQLYLSPTTAGAYTTTKPYAPSHLVYVGVVTRSHVSLGTIEVKVQNGYEMDELHNVSAQSPSNNDGLFYNTTTSLWEKKSIATVLGYTPYNGTDTSIKALFSASAPLSYSNGVYGISQATTSSNGYLSSTDWNTFNGKENVLSFTTPLVRTTNTISINQASASTSGFLSSTDWNTFNSKSSNNGTVTSVAMTMPLGLSVSGSPITTSGTFGITLTAGYVIPSTASATNWDTAYTNRITSLTTTGSSGSATLVSNVLNIPNYTLVGLGGQVALNGTGFVKATGTTISYDNTSYLPLSGGLMTNSIQFSDTTNLKRGIYGSMGTNDNWFIGANAGGANLGYLEIATGDDGTEPIYVTQYTGDAYTTGTVARRVKILDESGNSIFPNTLTATTLVKSGGTSSQYLMADGSVSTITNNITGNGTINELAYFNTASTVSSLPVATYPSLTELSYVKGVTSAIQTQINTKQGTISLTTTGTSGAATFTSNTLNIPNYGSALSGYLPLTGGTLTGALSGTSATFSGVMSLAADTWHVSSDTRQRLFFSANSITYLKGTGVIIRDNNDTNMLSFVTGGAATFSSSVTAGLITADNADIYAQNGTGSNLSIGFKQSSATKFRLRYDISQDTVSMVGLAGNFIQTWNQSGNVAIGTSSSLLSKLTVFSPDAVSSWNSVNPLVTVSNLDQSNGEGFALLVRGGALDVNCNIIDVQDYSGNSKFNIKGTGAATFSSSVTTSGGASGVGLNVVNATNARVIQLGFSTGSGSNFIQSYDGVSFQPLVLNNALTLASTGAATFSSSVTADGSGNGFLINQNGGAAGLATYSANTDKGQIAFKFAQNFPASNNYTRVLDIVSTGDATGGGMIRLFTTVNNSTPSAALTIASTGAATFSSSVTASDTVTINTPSSATALAMRGRTADNFSALRFQSNTGATTYSTIYSNASSLIFENGGSERMRITSGGQVLVNATIASDNVSSRFYARQLTDSSAFSGVAVVSQASGQFAGAMGIDSNGNLSFEQSYLHGLGSFQAIRFITSGAERMRITSGGSVGFGTTTIASDYKIAVYGTNSLMTFQNANTGQTNGDGFAIGSFGNVDAYVYNYENAPIIFGTNATARMRITSGGDVGIGLTAPLSKLHVNGTFQVGFVNASNTAMEFYWNGSSSYGRIQTYSSSTLSLNPLGNNVLIGGTTDNGEKLYVTGAIRATGNITANSDLTLKKNLELITNPIDKLMQLNGYSYQWKSDDSHQYGVIAQEVEKVMPYAVQTGNDKIKGVAYNQLTPLLIEGFKSHQSEITILKARVKYLESKFA